MITLIFLISFLFLLLVQMQSFAQSAPLSPSGKPTDLYTLSATNDSTWLQRNSDSLWGRTAGVITFAGRANPKRYIPWWLISYIPAIIRDTTSLSDSIGKKLDKIAFVGVFTAALTASAINTALGYTPYNGAINPNGYGIGTVTSVGITSTDFSISGSPVTTSGNITANLTTTGVVAGSYDGVVVDSKGRITSGMNWSIPTNIASGARNFNTAYRESTANKYRISLSPQVSTNLSLAGGQSGTITLQISPNGTTGWITLGILAGSNTGTLTIGLNTTQITGAPLTYEIPATYYYQMLTTNITGTPTFTFNGGSYSILQ